MQIGIQSIDSLHDHVTDLGMHHSLTNKKEQQWHHKILHFINTHTHTHRTPCTRVRAPISRVCPLGVLHHEGETQSDVRLDEIRGKILKVRVHCSSGRATRVIRSIRLLFRRYRPSDGCLHRRGIDHHTLHLVRMCKGRYVRAFALIQLTNND